MRRMVPFWGGSRRTGRAAASAFPALLAGVVAVSHDRSMSGLASIPSHLFDGSTVIVTLSNTLFCCARCWFSCEHRA